MKLLTKAALGALAVATMAVGATQPADARVVIGVGIGAPWGYPAGACGAYWYDPVYVDGIWYQGPICYRFVHGRRVFWINGGWRAHAWRGAFPRHFRWGHHGFVRWHGGHGGGHHNGGGGGGHHNGGGGGGHHNGGGGGGHHNGGGGGGHHNGGGHGGHHGGHHGH